MLKKTVLYSLCIVLLAFLVIGCNSLKEKSSPLKVERDNDYTAISPAKIELIFRTAQYKANRNWKTVKVTGKLPRSTERGFKPISDWTSGFYPGILWYIYKYTDKEDFKQKAAYATNLVREEQYNTDDHDIGFRIYCSYGNGFRLTHSKDYKKVIIQSAKSAIQRYDPKVKAIMSWEPNKKRDWQYPVIIDNMMNLELLFEATRLTGDSTYYNIAVNHARTTMKSQYRDDYSCAHVVDYDSITGKKRKMDWNNGNDDPSTAAWSRGQSWGLYGYTMAYRETGNKKFLKQAENIAGYILTHPNLPEDMVPYWDYEASDFSEAPRDASAAAIMASAFIELSQYAKKKGDTYYKAGEKVLKSLASKKYLSQRGVNDGFLLKHATGNFLKDSEVDGGLIYADYYFLEALLRYAAFKEDLLTPKRAI